MCSPYAILSIWGRGRQFKQGLHLLSEMARKSSSILTPMDNKKRKTLKCLLSRFLQNKLTWYLVPDSFANQTHNWFQHCAVCCLRQESWLMHFQLASGLAT